MSHPAFLTYHGVMYKVRNVLAVSVTYYYA